MWSKAKKENTKNVMGTYGIIKQVCSCCNENKGKRIDSQMIGNVHQTLRKCKKGNFYIVDNAYDKD